MLLIAMLHQVPGADIGSAERALQPSFRVGRTGLHLPLSTGNPRGRRLRLSLPTAQRRPSPDLGRGTTGLQLVEQPGGVLNLFGTVVLHLVGSRFIDKHTGTVGRLVVER